MWDLPELSACHILPSFKIKILLNKDIFWVSSLFIIQLVSILHIRSKNKIRWRQGAWRKVRDRSARKGQPVSQLSG